MDSNISYNVLRNRYPGVKPFTTDEQDLFFGRERDIADLSSLIFVKQVVTLYGKSGYGKSSLLNAGILPKLKAETPYQDFSIRFNNYSKAENQGVIPAETVNQRLRNILSEGEIALSPLNILTNGEDSFWHWIKTLQRHNPQKPFILFFDQFEELFTYPKDDVDAFSEQLAEILYSPIPVKYRRKLAELDGQGKIDDDFHSFLYQMPEVKIVFSIRSDRLSQVNNLTSRHPGILQNCYELAPLTKFQAIEAISKPSQLEGNYFTTPFTYSDKAVEKIIDGIANKQDGTIETSMLQIVCRYVEDTLVSELKKTTITVEDLSDINNIFQNYYEGVLAKLSDQDREKAQKMIEEKLITNERRNSLSDAYIGEEFDVSQSLLKVLEESSLLRKERDASGRLLYEVSHDTLVEPIQKVARVRLAKEKEIEALAAMAEQEKRQKELQSQVETERERVTELENLNKKVRQRSRRALVFAGLAFVLALACLLFVYTTKLLSEAEKSARLTSEKNLAKAKRFFVQTNAAEAKRFYGIAKSYIEYQEYQLALDNLVKAKQRLQVSFDDYKDGSAKFVNDASLSTEEIDAKMKWCENELKREAK